jgi:putative protease
VGEVNSYDVQTGLAEVEVKNKIQLGDDIEVIMPNGSHYMKVEQMLDQQGASIEVAPGSGWVVKLPLPEGCMPALIARFVDEEAQSVIKVRVDEPDSKLPSRRPSP